MEDSDVGSYGYGVTILVARKVCTLARKAAPSYWTELFCIILCIGANAGGKHPMGAMAADAHHDATPADP